MKCVVLHSIGALLDGGPAVVTVVMGVVMAVEDVSVLSSTTKNQ